MVRLRYKGISWESISSFKDEILLDLNANKSIYYAKICSRAIHVRCRICDSFRLIYSYDFKKGKECNIRYKECDKAYHTGPMH
ncbi:hypothetical protein FGO68_gene9988 [Halteria grandinella]|uniref:Uncharacterized protein n=1 Tax=Halteria grandinella TaxID=5974 RepID=A0A8J8T011_HALGN|nr:hypothetical protein FGO68_gene9988 [Halteria grandinella]